MSDKLREAFEREYELSDHDKARDDEGCYHDMAMESAFTHFQAGHAHAMRGKKVYVTKNSGANVPLRVHNTIESAKKDIEEYKKAFPSHDFCIVTYIRQEDE